MPFAMYNGIGVTLASCRLLGSAACLRITADHTSSTIAISEFLKGTGDFAHILSRLTLPSFKYLRLETQSKAQKHKLLEDFLHRSSCPLQQFILDDIYVDQESIVKYLTIPFLETIPDIQVYLGETAKDDVFQEMQELKDSQDTPTFRRLQISYPEGGPAFTWK
jgi:hypothetical protein